MGRTIICWREAGLECEYERTEDGGLLRVKRGAQVVAEEPVPSAVVAHRRARELAERLDWQNARRA